MHRFLRRCCTRAGRPIKQSLMSNNSESPEHCSRKIPPINREGFILIDYRRVLPSCGSKTPSSIEIGTQTWQRLKEHQPLLAASDQIGYRSANIGCAPECIQTREIRQDWNLEQSSTT